MVFRFYKNNSDNRKLNKDLTPLVVGETTTEEINTNIIPRVSTYDSKITSSSENGRYPNYGAFYTYPNNDFVNPDWDTCWLPSNEDIEPWIQYEFSSATLIKYIKFICFSNYSDSFTCDITISCSNDGINYTDVYTGNITGNLQTATNINIELNINNSYKYYKLSFNKPLYVPYEPSLFISNINMDSVEYIITPIYDMNVIFKTDETKDNPTLELSYKENIFENANYCYCVDTGYYFYLSEPTMSAQRLFYNANTDLLMTYKNDILKLGCILARQENRFNTYLKDSEQAILSKRVVDTRVAPGGFSSTDTFVLATCGN